MTYINENAADQAVAHDPVIGTGPNATTAKTLKSQLSDLSINLISYGAAGDGITDDSSVIQQLLNEGYRIYLPAGKTFLATNLTVPNGSLIYGPGTLKQKDSNPVLVLSSVGGIELKGFSIQGVSKDTNVITANQSNNFRIRGLTITGSIDVNGNCNTFTISKNKVNGSIVIDGNSIQLKVLYNETYGSSNNGIAFFTQIERAIVIGNYCHGHALNGIQLHSIINSTVSNNICESNTQSGFGINNAQTTNKPGDLAITNNVSMLNGYDGFDVYNGNALSNLRLTITGNQSKQNTGTGIYLSYASLVTVSANEFTGNGKQGILLNQSSYNVIQGNISLANGNNAANTMAGISLQDSTRNTVVGNLSTNQGGAANQKYGIEETGVSDYNLFDGNTTFNNATNEIIQKVGVNTKLGTNQPG